MPNKPAIFGRKRPTQRQGGSKTIRDTSAAYKRRRAVILANEPLCRYCIAQGRVSPATILDHKLALSLGGDDRPDNLIPACQPCNALKAKDEQRFLARGYDLRDIEHDPAMSGWLNLAARHHQSSEA